MRVSEKWLREWVNPKQPLDTVLKQLTGVGLEVEAVEPAAAALDKVVVGAVAALTAHPKADKLRLCTVDVGQNAPLSIVCGAANVFEGARVPVALVGANLPGGLTIKLSEIRGVVSHGMLCSASELGLSDKSDGLLILDEDAPIGTPFVDYLELNDTCVEFSLTPNRGDCLSVVGIAREVATINRISLNAPSAAPVRPASDRQFSIEVKAPEACPRYVGRVVEGLNPQARTPLWMVERLRRSGVRSIHPIVDITNYVLLELGQPMHAFDLSRLSGGIVVRMARKGEKLELLDGQTVTLDTGTLVIADRQQPVALAGVMGGNGSAVSDGTTAILLEAAFFSPDAVAGRARRYGLHTDSSHRFERGVDPELPLRAMERATELVLAIAGGKAGPTVEVSDQGRLPVRQPIRLRADRIRRLLGAALPAETVADILTRLGMKVSASAEREWQVTPPSYRFDVALEADLIEEVARVFGYDNLPKTLPKGLLPLADVSEQRLDRQRVRQLLADRGFQEAITYSFVNDSVQRQLLPNVEPIAVSNPIAADMGVMRASLWPGLLGTLGHNLKRQQSRVRLFELGVVFAGTASQRQEHVHVAGVMIGSPVHEQWGVGKRAGDFFDIKADVEALLALTGRADQFEFRGATHTALHPGQTAQIVDKSGAQVGWIGILHPAVARQMDLPNGVGLFEISLAKIEEKALPAFREISKFPSIRRDIALVVDKSVPALSLMDVIRQEGGALLKDLCVFDVYEGEGIDSGRKSLALGLTLQDSFRTLTDQDVDAVIARILGELKTKLHATLRE